ncbi:MAG TPA: carbohydrate porin [Polyangiaceae bacterium]|jgi:high affinity Mn2+ porin
MLHHRISFALASACAALILFGAPSAHAMSPRDEPSEDKPTPPVDPEKGEEEDFSLHFQSTMATAYHPAFSAKYSGNNSMNPNGESATAFVTTLYADQRLWPGAELLFDPEMSGGKGLSSTLGVAAFPTGIVYRVGDPAPAAYVARIALSQTFELGGGRVTNEAGPNELAGTRDRDVFAITVGKVSVTDVFDGNRYAHDATERFFDWALFASGAWDYPADTKGYTWGALADLAVGWWSARAGIALEPKRANEADIDWRVGKARGLMAEYEARYNVSGQHGALSTLVFLNQERAGSYAQVLADPARYHNDITETRQDGRTKYGIALSLEQQIRPGLGTFLRMSVNDGKTESWAFTEIDRSIATGVVQDGALWHRSRDEAGTAVVINGLSPEHRAYLEGGGYGFIIGDGRLNYGLETMFDIYYKLSLVDNVSLSGFYQPIINPGYNRDRGPVHVFTGRLHIAF